MSNQGKTWKQETTKQWEKFAHHCLTGGLEKFQREMAKLEGKDYVQSFLMMLKFVKPQFANVTLTDPEGKTLMRPIINVIQLPGQPPMVLSSPQVNLTIDTPPPVEDENQIDPTGLEPEVNICTKCTKKLKHPEIYSEGLCEDCFTDEHGM